MAVAGLLESKENPWILVSRGEWTPRLWRCQVSHVVESPAAKLMHISTIFYSGLEGLGGLEMQNKPIPRVCTVSSGWVIVGGMR